MVFPRNNLETNALHYIFFIEMLLLRLNSLLSSGGGGREGVLGAGSIPVAILTSCHNVKTAAL